MTLGEWLMLAGGEVGGEAPQSRGAALLVGREVDVPPATVSGADELEQPCAWKVTVEAFWRDR